MVDISARGMAAEAKTYAKDYTDSVIAALPRGVIYKGAVNYYSDLPASPTVGDCYTVKYTGTSGTTPDGSEYVWGTYDGTNQWIKIGGRVTDYDDICQIIKITNQGATLGDIATTLNSVNTNGKHVFFDVSSLGVMLYLCTIMIDTTANTYKILDLVTGKISEGSYDATKTLTVAMAKASVIATQTQIDHLQSEIDDMYIGEIGDVMKINFVTSLSVSSTSGGLTFTVTDEGAFVNAVGACDNADFLLVWDGTAWEYNEQVLTSFGITVTGTPTVGDVMTVSMVAEERSHTITDLTPTGTNATAPEDSSISNYYIVEQTYIPDTQSFDEPESALCITPGNTLAAGKYYIYNVAGATSDYWCNYKRLYYTLEVPHDITAIDATGDVTLRYSNRGSRETTGDARGIYQLYVKPYCEATNTLYNSDTLVFEGQVAQPSSEYTDLRTLTGFSVDQRMTIENDTRAIIYNNLGHVCYGNNEFDVSNIRQRMNSTEKSMNPTRQHKNDVVSGLRGKRGYLWGIDPRVNIKNAVTYQVHALSDEFTQNAIYSVTGKSFLLSMAEMGFNIQTTEGVMTDLYSDYVGGTPTNTAIASRAKADRAGLTPANYRWSRSATSSNSSHAWIVSPTGGYGNDVALDGLRFAPAYLIPKSLI